MSRRSYVCQFELSEGEICGAEFEADPRARPKYCPDHRDEARRRHNKKNRERAEGRGWSLYQDGVRPYEECIGRLILQAAKLCNEESRARRAREIIQEAGAVPTCELLDRVITKLDCEHCLFADFCPVARKSLRFAV